MNLPVLKYFDTSMDDLEEGVQVYCSVFFVHVHCLYVTAGGVEHRSNNTVQ